MFLQLSRHARKPGRGRGKEKEGLTLRLHYRPRRHWSFPGIPLRLLPLSMIPTDVDSLNFFFFFSDPTIVVTPLVNWQSTDETQENVLSFYLEMDEFGLNRRGENMTRLSVRMDNIIGVTGDLLQNGRYRTECSRSTGPGDPKIPAWSHPSALICVLTNSYTRKRGSFSWLSKVV